MRNVPWDRKIEADGKEVIEADFFVAHAQEHNATEWAAILGRSSDSIRWKANQTGISLRIDVPAPPPLAAVEASAKGAEERLFQGIAATDLVKRLSERPHALEELSQLYDRSEGTVLKAVEEMRAAGYAIAQRDQQVEMRSYSESPRTPSPTIADAPTRHLALALISDTHFGSKAVQISNLKAFMREATEQYGVQKVLVAGDIVAGDRVYSGQVQDLYAQGAEEQVAEALEQLPAISGVQYLLMGGNHDYSYYKQVGLNVVEHICQQREDLTYVGSDFAQIPLTPDLDVAMWHPAGGLPYALCLSQDSQILTRRGWASWRDISMSDEIATLNPDTHALEYQEPTALHIYEYAGPMVSISSRTVDLLVTPNHDLYVREYPGRSPGKPAQPWHKVQAEEIAANYKRQKWQMMMDIARWDGIEPEVFSVPEDKSPGRPWNRRQIGDVPIEAWLSFLGWYISEGHLSPKRVEITQKAGPKLDLIVEAMGRLGYSVTVYDHSTTANTKRAIIHAMQLVRWLRDNAGKGAAHKKVPRFIMDLSPRLIKVFLDALFAGDGWFDKDGNYGGYASISPQLRDDVQELLLKIGLASTITDRGLSIINDQKKPTINAEPEIMGYEGKVWCVTVPNGLIYARRNGRAIWTGNSYRGQRFLNQVAADELEKLVLKQSPSPRVCMVVAGHLHQSMFFRQGHIAYFQVGCWEGRNSFFKRKGWKPAIGGWIVELDITATNVIHICAQRDLWYYEIEDDYKAHPRQRYARRANVEVKPLFWMETSEQKG